MTHRTARLVGPLRRLLRRRRPRAEAKGPTVHHVGFPSSPVSPRVPVPGIGLGSLGMPVEKAGVVK
ncbi:hypothetical protein ACIG0D_01170 [Streptomyces sp. NPDC052773]|uniref:hypothetical protein n=1 Tax=Streptomyces sp. NPDC052773 TaxID=3365693 RepID=UPI0037D5C3ED